MVFTPQAVQTFTGVPTAKWGDSSDNGNGSNTQYNPLDISNMSPEDIWKIAQKDPDWYKNNAAMIDYFLEEKSYDRRWEKNNLKSQFAQLKELGINPMLAMSLLSGAGQSLSGSADSNNASFVASRENNAASVATSRANNITTTVRAALVGIIVALIGAML